MKIVILDAYALNPGDLSWDRLKKFGTIQVYDRTAPGEVAERIRDADVVLTNKAIVSGAALQGADRLKFIGVMATGFNVVDIEAAREQGIPVSNIPAYSTASVAQLVFAFILSFTNHLHDYNASVQKGDWAANPDFSYMLKPVIELQGKTLGIIGFGQIGQAVGRIALAFQMRVIASHKHPERDRMEGIEFLNQDAVFAQSDFVSLHCPLNEQNQQFVNMSLLKKMKSTAMLINTSRGGLIQEADLAEALNTGVISAAGLDVLSQEPPAADNPLLHAKNCLITPHIAWASGEARLRLMDTLEKNIQAFVNGQPQNVVNGV